jgi:hypothetical protein
MLRKDSLKKVIEGTVLYIHECPSISQESTCLLEILRSGKISHGPRFDPDKQLVKTPSPSGHVHIPLNIAVKNLRKPVIE